VRHQILLGRDNNPLLGGGLYAGGAYSEGGTYMLVNTVVGTLVVHLTKTIRFFISL
jgi:hypothetical protein